MISVTARYDNGVHAFVTFTVDASLDMTIGAIANP